MARSKRKYGEEWKHVDVDPHQFDNVFDKFFSQPPSPPPPVGPPSDSPPPQEGGPPLDVAPTPNVRPTRRGGATKESAPPPGDGVAESVPLALQINGPLSEDGPTTDGGLPQFSLLNSLPGVDGFLRWFNEMTDYLLPQLTPPEQAAYHQLYRLTWGFDRRFCVINFPRLGARSGMSENGARLAAAGLIRKGLVRKVGMVFGKNREQGIQWEVFEPPALARFRATRREGQPRKRGPSTGDGPSAVGAMKERESQTWGTLSKAGEGGDRPSVYPSDVLLAFFNWKKQRGANIEPLAVALAREKDGKADSEVAAWLKRDFHSPAGACPDCGGSGKRPVDPGDPSQGEQPCKHERMNA